MIKIVIKWLLIAASLVFIGKYIAGISVAGFTTALVFALILALLNILVRPILFILTLPVNILTLGLFSFVINGIIFAFSAYLIKGFEVTGIIPAILGALVVSIVGAVVDMLFSKRD